MNEGSRELAVYDVPDMDPDVRIDFLDSQDLTEIEDGIKKIEATTDFLGLIQGVAIVRIEREGFWRQAGFANLRAYRVEQAGRLGLPPSTLSNRRTIGTAYLDNKKLLRRVDLRGNVAKLYLLDEALAAHPAKEVIDAIKSMSYREFKKYIRPDLIESDYPDVAFTERDGGFLLDGIEVLHAAAGLSGDEKDFVSDILRAAYKARKGNLIPHVVPVYDKGEARAVDNFLKKYRGQK
jgi:hypothetical protein